MKSDSSAIPFLDLVAPHVELEDELVSVFTTALRTGRFAGGPMVEGFESDFAAFCDTRYCVGVGSGTDALRFALIGAGIQRGDAVITVPNTFAATVESILQSGALPEFIDVDRTTLNLDVEELRAFLDKKCVLNRRTGCLVSKRTDRVVRAIVPVHLYGQVADMDPILDLAERYNLVVVEDACQAHGAEYFSRTEQRWRRAGSIGVAGAFSFYPGKNLGACGEAGAVVTNDEDVARRVRILRDHGQEKKYLHETEGYNGRLDAIQAGILQKKLRFLPEWTEKRREKATTYNLLLRDTRGIVLPWEPTWSRSAFHLYVILAQNRTFLQDGLRQAGIGTGLHYPIPLHLQAAFSGLGYRKNDFRVAEETANQLLSLPMFPQLTFDQQRRVADTLQKLLECRADEAA